MPEGAAEYSMMRNYLDWLVELPWSVTGPRARSTSPRRAQVLDEDHFGLAKVKRRILEYLAVQKLKPGGKQPDPVLRRAARRRQDLARPEHRARHGPQVRAREPGRRP